MFTIVAAAFVISSTAQIAIAVLAEPSDAARPGGGAGQNVPPACAAGVRTLVLAVDRAVAAAAGSIDGNEAEKRYRAARSPEWDDAKRKELVEPCAGDARGADAVAAVSRLDRAAEGAIRRQTDELAPVRRGVDSFIR